MVNLSVSCINNTDKEQMGDLSVSCINNTNKEQMDDLHPFHL